MTGLLSLSALSFAIGLRSTGNRGQVHHLRMHQCFSQWEHALELWNAESDAAKHAESMAMLRSDLAAQQQKAVAAAALRWRLHGVAKCFGSWESWTAAAQHRRRATLHIQGRLRRSRICSALVAWHAHASWSARAKHVIIRSIRRGDQDRAALAFGSWAQMVSRKRRTARGARER